MFPLQSAALFTVPSDQILIDGVLLFVLVCSETPCRDQSLDEDGPPLVPRSQEEAELTGWETACVFKVCLCGFFPAGGCRAPPVESLGSVPCRQVRWWPLPLTWAQRSAARRRPSGVPTAGVALGGPSQNQDDQRASPSTLPAGTQEVYWEHLIHTCPRCHLSNLDVGFLWVEHVVSDLTVIQLLCFQLCEKSRTSPHPASRQIQLDLHRTLTTNQHFSSPSSPALQQLRRILLAFSWQNPDIGYCQGLNRCSHTHTFVLLHMWGPFLSPNPKTKSERPKVLFPKMSVSVSWDWCTLCFW